MNTRLIFLIILLSSVIPSIAQPDNPNNPVPLDGGLGLLAAGGIALALRKLKNRYKDSYKEDDTKEE